MGWDNKAPYKLDGSLCNYVYMDDEYYDYTTRSYQKPEWRECTPFEASLTVTAFKLTRNGGHYLLTNEEEGAVFPMTTLAMYRLVRDLCFTGMWKVQKQGRHYTLVSIAPRVD